MRCVESFGENRNYYSLGFSEAWYETIFVSVQTNVLYLDWLMDSLWQIVNDFFDNLVVVFFLGLMNRMKMIVPPSERKNLRIANSWIISHSYFLIFVERTDMITYCSPTFLKTWIRNRPFFHLQWNLVMTNLYLMKSSV